MEATPDSWVWTYHNNPQRLKENRIRVMKKFVSDLESGQKTGRYVTGQLPELEFKDREFDIALCSHFLFLYSGLFSYEFHLAGILEMLRIADEVRIFPLLTLEVKKSDYVGRVMADLEQLGYTVAIKQVDYEIQKGGNEMMQAGRA